MPVASIRLTALILALALPAGNSALCAGWMPTPEARMACCTEDDACPMHQPDSQRSGSTRAVSQAEADTCCAISERSGSAPIASTFVVAATLGVIAGPVPALVPSTTPHADIWRASVPAPGTHLPKHLLLSVLLV